jgi:hypothetical protein
VVSITHATTKQNNVNVFYLAIHCFWQDFSASKSDGTHRNKTEKSFSNIAAARESILFFQI